MHITCENQAKCVYVGGGREVKSADFKEAGVHPHTAGWALRDWGTWRRNPHVAPGRLLPLAAVMMCEGLSHVVAHSLIFNRNAESNLRKAVLLPAEKKGRNKWIPC